MSCGGNHQHSCEEIGSVILLSVDNELVDPTLERALAIHCAECPPCGGALDAHRNNVALLKSLLKGSALDEIPEALHEKLIAQTRALAAAMAASIAAEQLNSAAFTGLFTETFTQTTITVDGQTTIEISHTQEYREGF
jgi:hypothetical protein